MASMSTLVTRASPSHVFVVGSLVVACSAQVARCPDPGESLEATGFIMEAGGKGFNVALAAHRLGVTVDGLFAVGDDPPGHFMRTAFAAQGLDADLIHIVTAATGAGVGIIQADGENRIAVYPGANASLSVTHVTARADRLRKAGLIFAQFEAPDAPIAAAFALAREAERRAGSLGPATLSEHISMNPRLTVQRLLGHSNPATTMIYLRYVEDTDALIQDVFESWNDDAVTFAEAALADRTNS